MAGGRSVLGLLELVDSEAIVVQQARCAKVRNRNVECLKCADACTSGCITLSEGSLVVDAAACVGCGTCATVCPTCALEARNPSDAELLDACLRARCCNEVVVMCDPACRALAGLFDESAVAGVVCLGRVDESLVVGLAAAGVQRVRLVCGTCSRCEQEHGLTTAQLVAMSSRALLEAWDSVCGVEVASLVPEGVLVDGAEVAEAEAAMAVYFAELRGNTPIRGCVPGATQDGVEPVAVARVEGDADACCDGVASVAAVAVAAPPPAVATLPAMLHVMKDGTLPHFLPDRRERLLASLAALGQPSVPTVESRLWATAVIDGMACSSCRMCATFCPTGALSKFDNEDGTFGIDHYPGDCVKCGSCQDLCTEQAIRLIDQVDTEAIIQGTCHHYTMKPRAIELGQPHQILSAIRARVEADIFER